MSDNCDSSLAYVANDGDYCPRCKSKEIEAVDYSYDAGMYFHERKCLHCDFNWSDEYTLVSYYNITDQTDSGERLTDFLRATIRQLASELSDVKAQVEQIDEIVRQATTDNAPRHSAGDYLNMIARVRGLTE